MERPIAYMGDQPYIFVSYSHRDSDRVWPIILKLQADGYRIWYDDGISPGTEWDVNIARHIRECSFFLAFISENYLGSDNCKDELSFVRDLNKNRVLIYLEEVMLPDEMQMRLGRLQAIYWNRDGEKKAYQKLLLSPFLDTCREAASSPAAPETASPIDWGRAEYGSERPAWADAEDTTPAADDTEPEPEAEAPAAEIAPEDGLVPSEEPAADTLPSSEPDSVPEAEGPTMTPKEPKKGNPVKKASGRKKPVLFAGIGAALLLVLFLILNPLGSSNKKDPYKPLSGDATEEAASGGSQEASTSEYDIVSRETGSLFAGTLILDGDPSTTYREQQDLDYNGDTYTVALLPFTTISSYDDQNSIILGFYDKFDADFYFYGTYTFEDDTLTVSPGGSPGSFDKECAPLKENLTYSVTVGSDYIRLSSGERSANLAGDQDTTGILILKGSKTKDSQTYKGLQSLDLVLNIEKEKLTKCDILLEGDVVPKDISFTYWAGIHAISLKWTSVEYKLNGRTVTEKKSGSLSFYYINQNPGGFMITDDIREGIIYYYQDLSGF